MTTGYGVQDPEVERRSLQHTSHHPRHGEGGALQHQVVDGDQQCIVESLFRRPPPSREVRGIRERLCPRQLPWHTGGMPRCGHREQRCRAQGRRHRMPEHDDPGRRGLTGYRRTPAGHDADHAVDPLLGHRHDPRLDLGSGGKLDLEDLCASGETVEMLVEGEDPARARFQHLEAPVSSEHRRIGHRDEAVRGLTVDQHPRRHLLWGRYRLVMGRRRSLPNALTVIFTPGAA